MAPAGAGSAGRLPGALRAQAQDQQQQGRGEGQARGAERPRQPRLRPEAAHARAHVFRRPDCAQIRVAGVSLQAARPRDSARAQEAGQAVAPPGCHRGPSLKVPRLPSSDPPPLTHAHRPAWPPPPARSFWNAARRPPPPPLGSPPGGRKEKGLEPRGKGLGFPRLEPLKAGEKGISVLSWK